MSGFFIFLAFFMVIVLQLVKVINPKNNLLICLNSILWPVVVATISVLVVAFFKQGVRADFSFCLGAAMAQSLLPLLFSIITLFIVLRKKKNQGDDFEIPVSFFYITIAISVVLGGMFYMCSH